MDGWQVGLNHPAQRVFVDKNQELDLCFLKVKDLIDLLHNSGNVLVVTASAVYFAAKAGKSD